MRPTRGACRSNCFGKRITRSSLLPANTGINPRGLVLRKGTARAIKEQVNMSTYKLKVGSIEVIVATLGQVISYLNARRPFDALPLPKPASIEDVTLTRGGETLNVVRSDRGEFGVVQHGTGHDILLAMIDEIDREFVRPGGVLRAPHEMTRREWNAVVAVGSAAYGVYPCFTAEQRQERFPVETAGFGITHRDLSDLCTAEFWQRFGYTHNGPSYHGRDTNSRHEIHVEYALIKGKHVPEHVLREYRDGDARELVADAGFGAMVNIPSLRGRLTPEQFFNLRVVVRDADKLDGSKLEPFVSAILELPVGATSVEVDDHLFAKGLVPALEIKQQPAAVDTGLLTSAVARDLYDALATAAYRGIVDRADVDRAKGNLSRRGYLRQCAIADVTRNGYSTSYAQELGEAMENRAVGFLLTVLDQADGSNETSKQVFAKHYGVKLRGLNATKRRDAIFAFCGFEAPQRKQYEEAEQAAKEKKQRNRETEAAIQTADNTVLNFATGRVTVKAFIDKAVADGFNQLLKHRQGKHTWWLVNPTTGSGMGLAAKSGMLEYARDGLHLVQYQQAQAA
jgi:hypothetical protein